MKILLLLLSFVFAFEFGVDAQIKTTAKTPAVRSNTEPLKVGGKAPDFTLSDLNGKQVTLSKAEMPVVLVFYRGYW